MIDRKPSSNRAGVYFRTAVLFLAVLTAGAVLPDNVLLGLLILLGTGLFFSLHRTDRNIRLQQAELKASEESLREAQEIARIGNWIWDLRNNRVQWSDELYRIHGLPREEAPDIDRIRTRIVAEDLPGVDAALRGMKTGRVDGSVEYRYDHPEGAICHLVARARTVYDKSGAPVRLAGTVQDITVLKLAEERTAEHAVELEEGRRLAMNLMEDARASRVAAECLNERLSWAAAEIKGLMEAAAKGDELNLRFENILLLNCWEVMECGKHDCPAYENPENQRCWEIPGTICKERSQDRPGGDHGYCEQCAVYMNAHEDKVMDLGETFNQMMSILQDRQEALARSDARSRAILDSAADAIITIDSEGIVHSFNPAAERIFGYRSDEIVEQSVTRLVPASLDHPQSEGLARYFESGDPDILRQTVEVQGLRKDGTIFPLELTVDAIDGMDRFFTAIGRDITERRNTEDELRRFSAVVEQSPVAVVLTNTEGDIEYVNPNFSETTGYSADEVIGQNPRILKSGDMSGDEYKEIWETILAGNIWRGEFHNRKKTGELFWEAASISPLRNSEGKITHFLAVKEDITERKEAEEQLKETNILLEEQTALANSLAAQSELASAAKSEFLANMSHEIRTPMNGLIGMTGLLLDTELTGDQRRYAEIVNSSAESLLGLINDILDFSKIEAGKLEMETLDFDLRGLLDDFAEMMALKTQEKNLELICATAPDVPSLIQGDPGRLRQVLINLTANAAKFTHEGEIVVRADLQEDSEESVLIRFAVRDSGIGIPANRIDNLFQKFTQVDASTTRKYGGTGLGLAISKQLAEAMGGKIGVKSEEGKGSEFYFTARFLKQPERKEPQRLSTDLPGARVLVVDDSASNRTVLLEQLTAWGAEPGEASGAESCFETLRQASRAGEPYRVVILDMQMKGMGGEELGKAIRADSELAATLLMMMTSVGKRGDAKRLEDIGFAAYLVKPVRHSDLFDTLATLLTGRKKDLERKLITRHSLREIRRGAVRILLAEDNIVNQKVALGILKKLGLSADCVANGKEAVKALADADYDLVLMDCQMPEMDGYKATAYIRDPSNGIRRHDIPIIAMTAHAMQGDREKCLDAGMNDYLSKPVNPQSLADMLEKWLPDKRKSAPPAPTQAFGEDRPADLPGGDPSEILDFLENIPRRIEALKSYVESGDAPGVVRQAGSIFDASCRAEAWTIREVASWIEKSGEKGDMNTAQTGIIELEAQIEKLKGSLGKPDKLD